MIIFLDDNDGVFSRKWKNESKMKSARDINPFVSNLYHLIEKKKKTLE